jgi:DNA-binding MarR family transcriptional regulator
MPADLSLDDHLCFSLYAASMAITRVYKPLLDEMGITYPQYLVLQALREEGGRTIGTIAGRLSLEPSTVTPLVKRLEASGLVERQRDSKDERQVRVSLTARGRAILDRCHCLGETLAARAGMTGEQLGALNREVRGFWEALRASATND